MMGGKSGVFDHVTIGDGASIGACSTVTRDVEAGATYLGFPADEAKKTLRQWAAIRKLPELIKELSRSARERE
jgi:UDP-3-O-[3-hydroxymyristoyl] glucosamine N-acyltransferase